MTFNKFVFFCMTEYDVLKGRITIYHIFWKIHYSLTESSRSKYGILYFENLIQLLCLLLLMHNHLHTLLLERVIVPCYPRLQTLVLVKSDFSSFSCFILN